MSSSSQQPSSNTWTEPPWSGWIETTGDALLILEAARRGLIPRVTRRLVESERKMITSGSVFVFDEDESGIKRWTDGFFWSPSRILGNFLLYRETDKRGAGHRGARSDTSSSDVNDQSQHSPDGVKLETHSLSRPKGEGSSVGVDKHRERTLMGSLTNSYKFKPDGLMKKTFSLTIGGVSQHLISYYKIEDVENGRLRSPSSLPELASLDINPEYLDKTHFRNPPKVEIGVDGLPRYRGEADDIDSSPSLITGPLSSGLPLLTDIRVSEGASGTSAKRGKRYDPYPPVTSKRPRRNTQTTAGDTPPSPDALSPTPVSPSVPQTNSPQGYADSAMSTASTPAPAPTHTHVGPPPPPPPHYPPYGAPGFFQVPAYSMHPPPTHMYGPPPYPPGTIIQSPGQQPQTQQQAQQQQPGVGTPRQPTSPTTPGAGAPGPPPPPPPPMQYPYAAYPHSGVGEAHGQQFYPYYAAHPSYAGGYPPPMWPYPHVHHHGHGYVAPHPPLPSQAPVPTTGTGTTQMPVQVQVPVPVQVRVQAQPLEMGEEGEVKNGEEGEGEEGK